MCFICTYTYVDCPRFCTFNNETLSLQLALILSDLFLVPSPLLSYFFLIVLFFFLHFYYCPVLYNGCGTSRNVPLFIRHLILTTERLPLQAGWGTAATRWSRSTGASAVRRRRAEASPRRPPSASSASRASTSPARSAAPGAATRDGCPPYPPACP